MHSVLSSACPVCLEVVHSSVLKLLILQNRVQQKNAERPSRKYGTRFPLLIQNLDVSLSHKQDEKVAEALRNLGTDQIFLVAKPIFFFFAVTQRVELRHLCLLKLGRHRLGADVEASLKTVRLPVSKEYNAAVSYQAPTI